MQALHPSFHRKLTGYKNYIGNYYINPNLIKAKHPAAKAMFKDKEISNKLLHDVSEKYMVLQHYYSCIDLIR